ncbi:hypothetical protein C100_15955 [Sphingobium sp. C100]|nr:hypothetical protein C100_15955 [Sphingobium sp. C100]
MMSAKGNAILTMNPIIKAQLNEFKKSNPDHAGDEADNFEVMSLFAVENGILGENIDPFKAHLKGHEFGLDGIAILIQGELCTDSDEASAVLATGRNHTSEFHFFQSKTSDKMDYGEVSKFLDAVFDFFTDLSLLSGQQIEDLSEVRDAVFTSATKSNPSLKCYYCTTGTNQISEPIKKLIDANKDRLEALSVFESVSIQTVGAKEIQEGFRAATNSTSATVNFPKAITLPDHEKVDQAYIGYVSADQVLAMSLEDVDGDGIQHIRRNVFYDNVRDFNPDSEINKSIIAELEAGDYSSFVFKNNGITVVARSITRKGDQFNIDDFQIVNGCQTTNILSHVKDHAVHISVPFRLIGSSDSDFVSSIIIGTNKQNEVREDQFWALLPFMKDLEVYCRAQETDARIFIERRDNQYRDVSVERTRIMKPSDLMKIAAAMLFFQPQRAARDHRGIRKEFSQRIFQEKHSVELYHMIALALYKFDYMVRTGKTDRARVIYKFYILFSLVREKWTSPDILDASPKSQLAVIKYVMDIIQNSDKFSLHINKVGEYLDILVSQSSAKTREQIRDYIRTESFAEQFIGSYFEGPRHHRTTPKS